MKQTENRYGELPIALRIKFPVPRSPFPVPCSLFPVPRLCIIIANKIYVGLLDKETLTALIKHLLISKTQVNQRYEDNI